jgi:hypothetical protein
MCEWGNMGVVGNMRRSVFLRAAACVVAVCLALASGGCWNPFAPDEGGGGNGGGATYLLRTTHANVLNNLVTAYEDMNAEEYLDCLADTFIFYLNPADVTPGSGLPKYWSKATEDTIAHNMFDDGSSIDNVDLTLTQYGAPVDVPWADPYNPKPPRVEYKENVDLRVYVGETTYWANAGGTYLFDIDDEKGPDGETLYEIVQWQDVDKFGSKAAVPGPGEEPVSVGELKAMFRQ